MKNFFRLLLCVACASVMAGCEKEEEEYDDYATQNIKLTKDEYNITLGGKHNICLGYSTKVDENYYKLEYIPNSDYDKMAITWKSDDEYIATVDNEGYVTANSLGTTYISLCIDGKNNLRCKINVVPNIQFEAPALKQYLLENGYDNDHDGEISIEEAKSITMIGNEYEHINPQGHYSLAGIEFMPNLKCINISSVSFSETDEFALTAYNIIDFSYNPKLEFIKISGYDKLEKVLNIGENVMVFEVYSPNLNYIDEFKNPSIVKMFGFFANKHIKEYDLTLFDNLKHLELFFNQYYDTKIYIKKNVYDNLEYKYIDSANGEKNIIFID